MPVMRLAKVRREGKEEERREQGDKLGKKSISFDSIKLIHNLGHVSQLGISERE